MKGWTHSERFASTDDRGPSQGPVERWTLNGLRERHPGRRENENMRQTADRSIADIIVNGFTPEEQVSSCCRSIGNYLLHTGLEYTDAEEPAARLDRMAAFLDRVSAELRSGRIPVAGDFERLAEGLR